MIFTRDFVTRENHCQIASLVFVTRENHWQITSLVFVTRENHWQIASLVFLTRENHRQIASLVTQKSLFTVTNVLFNFLHPILCSEHLIPLKTIISRLFRDCC